MDFRVAVSDVRLFVSFNAPRFDEHEVARPNPDLPLDFAGYAAHAGFSVGALHFHSCSALHFDYYADDFAFDHVVESGAGDVVTVGETAFEFVPEESGTLLMTAAPNSTSSRPIAPPQSRPTPKF